MKSIFKSNIASSIGAFFHCAAMSAVALLSSIALTAQAQDINSSELSGDSTPTGAVAPSAWVQPVDVVRVPDSGRVQQQGEVEVVEFFWYGCSHCAKFEPEFAQWRAQQSSAVRVVTLPVSWNAMMLVHQRMYFTLEALGRLDLHSQVFDDVANADDYLANAGSVLKWAQAQGISAARWNAVYNSASVNQKIANAQKHFERFGLTGVPALVVDGEFQVLSTPQRLQTLDALVQQRLSARLVKGQAIQP